MPVIKSKGYEIFLEKNSLKILNTFLKNKKYSAYFILCDENTMHLCLPQVIIACPILQDAQIIELESGEETKSIEFSAQIWQTLIENKADKNTLMINLGGGVVSDLGGFCASTFKRGIDFINIPTTLLAMADASVGGKTGINFSEIKNVIGLFAQPKGVFINTHFLKTLPKKHFQNGLAEIFKIALVSDKKLWQQLKHVIFEENSDELIFKSISLKNKLVKKDPFDKGLRNILNFGHTVGHAIESLLLKTKNELLHGEAIVIGMLIESHISFQKKSLSKKELEELVSIFKATFNPQKLNQLTLTSIIPLLYNDKKTLKNKLQFALIDNIGSCRFNVTVNETQLKKAIDFYNTIV